MQSISSVARARINKKKNASRGKKMVASKKFERLFWTITRARGREIQYLSEIFLFFENWVNEQKIYIYLYIWKNIPSLRSLPLTRDPPPCTGGKIRSDNDFEKNISFLRKVSRLWSVCKNM